MLFVELGLLLLCIVVGARLGGIALATVSGMGLAEGQEGQVEQVEQEGLVRRVPALAAGLAGNEFASGTTADLLGSY